MKKILTVMVFAVGLVAVPPVFAGHDDMHGKEVNVENRICPIAGEEIASGKEVKYEYNGKIYNLCCGMCKKDFDKNPEKYSKIAEDSVMAGSSDAHGSHSH